MDKCDEAALCRVSMYFASSSCCFSTLCHHFHPRILVEQLGAKAPCVHYRERICVNKGQALREHRLSESGLDA